MALRPHNSIVVDALGDALISTDRRHAITAIVAAILAAIDQDFPDYQPAPGGTLGGTYLADTKAGRTRIDIIPYGGGAMIAGAEPDDEVAATITILGRACWFATIYGVATAPIISAIIATTDKEIMAKELMLPEQNLIANAAGAVVKLIPAEIRAPILACLFISGFGFFQIMVANWHPHLIRLL